MTTTENTYQQQHHQQQQETKAHLIHPKYRPDIDGLRAIAVLSVVVFHAFPATLAGGFIGVDIFFVISGFLISTIIFESLSKSKFSFFEFYSRRIKRIFPALLAVLSFCLLFGWTCLFLDEYMQLGSHVSSASRFIMNFALWKDAGYFDNTADTKPLLHLWSLGIEEQFYIIWPLILWMGWKKRVNLFYISLVVVISSFIINISLISSHLIAAFYSPFSRFWELVAGGLLAYAKINFLNKRNKDSIEAAANDSGKNKKIINNSISFLGLAMIFASLYFLNKDRLFPGFWALLPTLGAVSLILAGPSAWFNRVVLSNKILVWFGLISFPLYLWHWPLLSFARILGGGTPRVEIQISLVLLSVLLAWLTYYFIEKPIRSNQHSTIKSAVLVFSMICIGVFGHEANHQKGFSSRAMFKDINNYFYKNPSRDLGYQEIQNFTKEDCGITNEKKKKYFATCIQDIRENPTFLLLGDSKAQALGGGLIHTSNSHGRWTIMTGSNKYGAPVPVLSKEPVYKKFQVVLKVALQTISTDKNIQKVAILTSTRHLFQLKNDSDILDLPSSPNYQIALQGLSNAVEQIVKSGKKVILVTDSPTLPHPEDCLSRTTTIDFINKYFVNKNASCVVKISDYLALSAKYHALLTEVQKKYSKDVKVFDTLNYFCDKKLGVCTGSKDGKFLYSYTDHMSYYAAGLIGKDLNEFMLND